MTPSSITQEPKDMKTFFIIWIGQLISMMGTELTSFGLGVWIYDQTGKATPFALTALFATLPRLLLSPIAGVFADRYNRRKIMIFADTGDALVTLSAVFLLFSGNIEVWHIYIIAFISSCFTAFQGPAAQASVTMLVPKDQLARAGGIMQMGQATTMILVPVLAGVLYGLMSIKWIMVIDFITFFFAIGTLLLVRIPQPKKTTDTGGEKASIWSDVKFGWQYLVKRRGLFWMLWYFALINFLLSSTNVLSAPLILSFGTATDLGVVQMVSGIAMLLGGIIMSAWGGPKTKKIWYVIGFIALSGIGMIVTGLSPSTMMISIGRFFFLICIPFASALSQAVFQTKVAPDVQGRVFSIRGMFAGSMIPIAFILSGPLNDVVFGPLMVEGGAWANTIVGNIFGTGAGRGAGLMFAISGILLAVASLLIFLNPRVRNVENELPDIEIEVAAEEIMSSDAVPEVV